VSSYALLAAIQEAISQPDDEPKKQPTTPRHAPESLPAESEE
jgi:hypothetical protein